MTRLCIIGDSHTAALKFGWDEIRDRHPDVDVTFFAAPGGQTGDIVLRDGALVGRTPKIRERFTVASGGRDSIVLRDYDRFALVAMGIGLRTVLNLYTRHRLDSHRGYPAPMIASPMLFRELARAALRQANATRLRELITTQTDAPICHVPEPLPSEDLAKTEAYDASLRAIFTGGFSDDCARIYGRLLAEIRADGTRVVTQPKETMRTLSTTRREYSVGSARVVGRQHGNDECLHMNALYGEKLMSRLLSPTAGPEEEDAVEGTGITTGAQRDGLGRYLNWLPLRRQQ